MKIAFFGTKDYDRLWFEPLTRDKGEGTYNSEIRFFEVNLNQETAVLAKGYEAACVFVNADCGRSVLEILRGEGVKLLLLRCAGFNQVDLEAAKEYGITVLRVPGYSPEAVAEHAMALALAANRRIHKAYSKVRNNDFSLSGLLGWNLHNGTAGIVGTGRIGAAMARICRGFGMTVLAYDTCENPAMAGLVTYVSLEELLKRADLISLHCPLFPSTYHMINRDTLGLMKETAMLVNTSRGALIDTEALIEALKNRRLSAVGLDVYEDEDDLVYENHFSDIITNETVARLLMFPQVIITSHQAFFTREALQSIAVTTMENVFAYENGLELTNEVK